MVLKYYKANAQQALLTAQDVAFEATFRIVRMLLNERASRLGQPLAKA